MQGRSLLQTSGSTAIIPIIGPMLKGQSLLGRLGFQECDTSEVTAAVNRAASDPAIAAIILKIDSPGGSARGVGDLSDAVYAARAAKPVVAFIEDLGASAAYHVASQATKVYSNRSGVVGSIGVYAVVPDLSQLYSNIGVKVHVLRAGEFKGAGTSGTQITDAQLAEFQRVVDGLAELFVAAVARGRGFSVSKAKGLADGRVHIGQQAVAIGLVDGLATWPELVASVSASGTGRTSARQSASENAIPQGRAAIQAFHDAVKQYAESHSVDRVDACQAVAKRCPSCTGSF